MAWCMSEGNVHHARMALRRTSHIQFFLEQEAEKKIHILKQIPSHFMILILSSFSKNLLMD